MRGRRTEINYLNGYVSEQGRQVGVKTPVQRQDRRAGQRARRRHLKPDPKNLDPLWAMVPH